MKNTLPAAPAPLLLDHSCQSFLIHRANASAFVTGLRFPAANQDLEGGTTAPGDDDVYRDLDEYD